MAERKSTLHRWELIALAAVAAVAVAVFLLMRRGPGTNLEARIYHSGELVKTVDLDRVPEGEIDLPGEQKVHFEVKDHQIRFARVDCPDKICEQAGFLKKEGDIAVCMPNQYHVKLYSKGQGANG